MSTQIVSLNDLERMATAVAKSNLFGIKTPEQALSLMLIAQAEGMHPAIAARDYHVIQGRPALRADALLARFQNAGGKVSWDAYTDTKVSGTFSHPAGGSTTVTWTIEQAKAAGLASKDNWRQYPRAMLRARVVSEGIRTVYPGVSVGVYTPEEIEDFDAKPAKPEPKEVKAEPVVAPKAALKPAEITQEVKPVKIGEVVVRTKQPLTDERKYLFGRIKTVVETAKWGYQDLSAYIKAAFGAEESGVLTTDELKLVAAVCETSTFEAAMNELQQTSAFKAFQENDDKG